MEPEGSILHSQVPATRPYLVPDQSSPYPPHSNSWRSILILSSHLCLGLPSGLLPSGFRTKTLYTPLLFPICAPYPSHHSLLDFITQTILSEGYRSLSSSLCSYLHSFVISSYLGPNILNTLFSNTSSLHSSLSVGDQVSRPYKMTGRIIVLCILIFKVLDSKGRHKILHRMIASFVWLQSGLNFLLNRIFIC